MGDNTGIEWTEATWNPIAGCSKVSPGCDNCYAIHQAHRMASNPNPKIQSVYIGTTQRGDRIDWTGHISEIPERLDQPIRWSRPRRIFVNSMSDLFHPGVSTDYIGRVWDVMVQAHAKRGHTFQVLTKRPGRIAKVLGPNGTGFYAAEGPVPCPQPGIWMGTSVESNDYLWRVDHLRSAPAVVRWLSIEPLLGPLPDLDLTGIDWVVVGGESGSGARPMHPDWVRDIRDRCVEAGTPFFFKQWGEWAEATDDELEECGYTFVAPGSWSADAAIEQAGYRFIGSPKGPNYGGAYMKRVGKKLSGRLLDDEIWNEYPEAA